MNVCPPASRPPSLTKIPPCALIPVGGIEMTLAAKPAIRLEIQRVSIIIDQLEKANIGAKGLLDDELRQLVTNTLNNLVAQLRADHAKLHIQLEHLDRD